MPDFECCAVAAEHQLPRWLAGLIARHGEPLIVRRVVESTDLEYEWPDRIVRVGESWGTHFVVAARCGGRVVNLSGLDHQPTDADVSAVVALAGLCDAPERAVADPIVPTPLPGPVDDHVDRVSGPIRTAEQPATVRRVRSS